MPRIENIVYCGVCSLPPEYCEFGPSPPKCKTWLQTAHPSLFSTLFPAEGLSEGVAALAVTGDGSDGASASAGKPKQPQGKRGAPQPPKITVKRVERNKRKHVTHITNLESFDIDLKKAAKLFAGKFACGASVSKTVIPGKDEIVIQGDVIDALMELVVKTWPHVTEKDMVVVEEKKKVKKGKEVAPQGGYADDSD